MNDYKLVPLRKQDIFLIMKWRNDQIDVLRQKFPLDEEDQVGWYEYINENWLDESPNMLIYSYLYGDECIGYGGLTHIDWDHKRAEMSFLLSSDYLNRIDSFHALEKEYERLFRIFIQELIYPIAFKKLGLHRIYTETYAFRNHHIKTLEGMGFKLEGTLMDHIFMEGEYVNSIMHGILNKEKL